MTNLQFFKYLTIGLFLMNMSLIAFFFVMRPKPPAGPFRGQAPEMMQLDQQQRTAFSRMVAQHVRQMEGYNNAQRTLLQTYFDRLLDSTITSNTDTLLRQIQQVERQKIESTYNHFEGVQALLRPEQQAGFERFVRGAMESILTQSRSAPPPPKVF